MKDYLGFWTNKREIFVYGLIQRSMLLYHEYTSQFPIKIIKLIQINKDVQVVLEDGHHKTLFSSVLKF